MTRLRLARIFWMGAAAIVVAAALVALTAVVRGDFSDNDGRILGTLAAVLLAGSTMIAGLALVERGNRLLGWSAVAVSAPSLALVVYAIWDFVFDGGDHDGWRYGWTGALVLFATVITVTARLLARTRGITRLATAAGALAALATAVSITAVWSESPGDTFGKTIAVLWILTGVAYLLVPVLQRFGTARAPTDVRILAELDGIELVATSARDGAIDASLEPGERLLLRRRV